MSKEGYKPTSGMQSAARRAIKLKEQGKANGAGTAVGWTRAGQLARGEALSLSTVKRMYSYFYSSVGRIIQNSGDAEMRRAASYSFQLPRTEEPSGT